MLKYEYKDNLEGGKTLIINNESDIIMMNLHESVEGHLKLIEFLASEDNLKNYVDYLASNPNRPFNITEILAL